MRKAALITMALTLVVALPFCLSGCGSSGDNNNSASSQESRSANSVGDKTETNGSNQEVIELALNEPVSTEDYEFVFTEAYWESPNEEGNWNYYQDGGFTVGLKVDEGSVLYLVKGSFTNNGSKAVSLQSKSVGKATFNGKYEYSVKVQPASNKYDIEPLQTKDIYLYVTVPETMKDQFESVEILWGLDTNSEYIPKIEELSPVYSMYFK